MTVHPNVTFRSLDAAECTEVLRRHHVGRLAFGFHDRVDIEPISYIYGGEWLGGRTERGTKIESLLHHPWVAFEVDEVDGPLDWRSVVIQGTVYLLEENSPEYLETVAAMRRIVPQVFTGEDPTPQRNIVFRVYPHEIVGRSASTHP